MNRKGQTDILLTINIIGLIIIIIILFLVPCKKQGQIDYANGIIKYELKEQPDKAVVWVERSK